MRSTSIRPFGAGLAIAVLAAFAAAGPTPVAANPDNSPHAPTVPAMGPPSERPIRPDSLVQASNQLDKLMLPGEETEESLAKIKELILEQGYDDGLVGIETDYGRRQLRVSWEQGAPNGLPVAQMSAKIGFSIVAVPHAGVSRRSIEEGVDRLNRETARDDIANRYRIVGIDVPDDNSEVVFRISGHEKLSEEQVAHLRAITGFEVLKISYGHEPVKTYASRQDDAAPWRGGARIQTRLGLCTSGFAVLTSSGGGRLLSARHCDPSGDGAVRDGAGTVIAPGGNSVSVIGSIDSMLIDPTASPATTPRIYRGSHTSSTYSTVKSWYSNWKADPVCSSGAAMGERCGIVYDDNDFVSLDGYQVNVIQVKGDGAYMGGAGDSGGPMFKKLSNGVQARGILLGPDMDYPEMANCAGLTNRCSKYINYVPISTILNTWGVRLEVG